MCKKKIQGEALDYLIEHFPTMENNELARRLGVSRHTIDNWRKKLRLKKDEEYLKEMHHRKGVERYAKTGPPPITEEAIKRRAEAFKKTYRTEKCRIAWGLEQKTGLRIRVEPRAKTLQRNYLAKRGYIIDKRNNIAYYTEDTRRSTRLESKDYKFKKWYAFQPYENHKI